jgi:chorismate mutase
MHLTIFHSSCKSISSCAFEKRGELSRMTRAKISEKTLPEKIVPDQLLHLRRGIDNIDASLVYMLAERFRYTQQVGALKAQYQLPAADSAREAQQIERLRKLAEDAQLDPDFAEEFLNFIIKQVIRHHEAIKDSHVK